MLKKVRLKEKDDYQALFLASRVAPMLEALLEGRPGPAALGSEHGGISCWDDLVVLGVDRSLHHVQLKRQTTAFSSSPIARPDAESTLSELDETLASLADWVGVAENRASKRSFEIAVLSEAVEIKKGLTLRWLEELCNDCRKDGVIGAELAQRTDGPTLKIYAWLTSWCRFADWDHVVSALSRLSISHPGNEAILRAQIRDSLARNFANPDRALELLVAYVAREGIDVTQITAENVFSHLHDLARPELVTWTQYRLEGPASGWVVCGTNAIPANDDEPPSPVVARLWDASAGTRKLRISALCQHNDASPHSLPAALIRLALHVQGPNQAFLSDQGEWRTRARYASGHTLGLGDDDFDDLCWAPNTENLDPSCQRLVKGADAIRDEAIALREAMDEVTWQQVIHKMENLLAKVPDENLNCEMRKTWDNLREALANNSEHRAKLFVSMMYPPGESLNRNHAFRVGPRAAALIANGLLLLTLVAVGLECEDASCDQFGKHGAVQTLATQRWSGPRGQEPAASELDSHGLTALMDNKVSPIVILAGVGASPTDVLDTNFAADAASSTSLAAERTPKLLVTKSRPIRTLLATGTLESVRHHFRTEINKSIDAIDDAVRFQAGH